MKKIKDKQMPDEVKERLQLYRSLMNYCVATCLAISAGSLSIIIKHGGFFNMSDEARGGFDYQMAILGLAVFAVIVVMFLTVLIKYAKEIR